MGTTLALVGGLVAVTVLCIVLLVRSARKEGRTGAEARVVREGREREAEAERHLDGPRRRGTALLDRLRGKRRGGPPPAPPAT